MMKFKFSTIILYFVCTQFLSYGYSSEVNLNVNLLKTGQYNVSDFLDPSVSLWTVMAQCVNCPEEGLDYRLEVKLSFNDIKPAIWGVTYIRSLSSGSIDILTNFDFQGGAGLLQDYDENEEFISQLEETYYLPAGNVELSVTAYEACSFNPSWKNNFNVGIDGCSSLTAEGSLSNFSTFNNVVSELDLLSPINNGDVLDPYPWFRWESPGFAEGVRLDYKLKLYLFDPRFHSSYLDAIEDDNYLYFSTDIIEAIETGAARQIQVQYPSDDRELACGYQYVWFVQAQDIIQDPPFNGETGIWGWPEPILSPLFTFSYGSVIRSDNVISPSVGSRVSTVRPSFHIDHIGCANSYEIWLSDSEDSEVENPIWTSGASGSNINTYPFDATGLAPNGSYKWKIRLNPDGEVSPWSDIFDFSISDYSLDSPISGEELTTVTPTFYFTVPMDMATYELRISDSDDPNVESGNIFSETISSTSFQLPQDISTGLLPGNIYYWKIIFFDGNDNIIGEIDDYNRVEVFRIKGVELSSPSNGANNVVLTPSFIWNGVTGVAQYELSISDRDDPTVENPFFSENISGTFFQYPQFADYPLESGVSYYWKIIPLDANENRGISSEIFSFSTIPETNTDSEREDEEETEEDEFDEDVFSDDEEEEIEDSEVEIEDDEDVDIVEEENDDVEVDIDEDEVSTPDEEEEIEDSEVEIDEDQDVDIGEEDDGTETETDTESNTGDDVASDDEDSEEDENISTDSSDDTDSDNEAITAGDSEDDSDTTSGSEDIDDTNTSNMVTSEKPEFTVTASSEDYPKNIMVSLLARVLGADEYIIYFALDQEMESNFAELNLVENQTEITFDGSDLEWDLTVYIQIFAMADGDIVGEVSSIQVISLPEKPGSNDQVGITISLEEGSTQPTIEIINTVTNAFDYMLEISTDSEMAEIFYYGPVFDNMPTIYPDFAPPLLHGQTYYVQVSAADDDGMHGIPSSVTTIFIPNVIPPVLKDEFSWDATIPAANSYYIQISTTDDFSSIVIEDNVEGLNYTLSEGILDSGTLYYWRVQGIDSNNGLFGNESNTHSFETEGEPVLIESMEGGQIVLLHSPTSGEAVNTSQPIFQWEAIDSAEKYEIRVGTSEDYSEILWQSSNVSQNSVQYPSSGGESLVSETPYFWSVRAITNDVALGEYSLSFEFTVSEDNTPILTGPMNEISESIHPFFTWNKIPRASSYGLILGNDEDCKQVILESPSITQRHFQYPSDAPPLEYDRTYFWQVVAYDENENELGDYSAISSFTTPSGIIEIEFIYSEYGK
ncbi:MAG: hypothetical protein H8E72_02860 [Candidatus Marinimicrobia bacterium]|nr:hypothetical protein [Candidatus Neomarinimicrobiota bacterium]